MSTRELVNIIGRFIGLVAAIVVFFLGATMIFRPIAAQNGETLGEKVASQQQRLETQEQKIARLDQQLLATQEQLALLRMAFAELKGILTALGGVLTLVFGGQLIVSLRKKT